MRRLILLAAALALAGCVAKRPVPAPPPPPAPEVTRPKPQPRPKPALPAAQVKASPAEGCRSLALQRESDARSLGRDAKAQRIVRDETYADCMSGKSAQ